jgi:hypothetical protein
VRAGNVFSFVFSPVDQALIDETSLIVEDVPSAATPVLGAPYPQSLRLRFKVKDSAKLPSVRPLAPGRLSFQLRPGSPSPPAPGAAIPGNYPNFPTKGRLMLSIVDTDEFPVFERMTAISGLPVVPDTLWYAGVELTADFLFTSLAALGKTKILRKGAKPVLPSAGDWVNHAVSGFLRGRVRPIVALGATPTDDSAAKVAAWPTVVLDAGGNADLVVTAARAIPPFDGLERDMELGPAAAHPEDPAHPRFGAIPARHVYRSLRAKTGIGDMIGAAAGAPVADRVLASSTSGLQIPRYSALRFTRIWKPDAECSVHFPSQVVELRRDTPTGTLFAEQRLPCHGVLFLGMTQAEMLVGRSFAISLRNPGADKRHELRWLTGEAADPWRDSAATEPVIYDLFTTPSPHILLRRLTSQEVIYDRRDRPSGDGCTYFSMRRTVRALVNNQIAGGRLNHEVFFLAARGGTVGRNTPATRALVRDALGTAVATGILDKQPDVDGRPGNEAPKLLRVLEALFPAPVNLATAPADAFSVGKVAYYVWQSAYEVFQGNDSGNFAPDWLGGGGPAALVVLGLAADYTVNPPQTVPMNRAAIVQAMIGAKLLTPGAPLQFWVVPAQLAQIRNRTVPSNSIYIGHSPVFLDYQGAGMRVLDQNGEPAQCDVAASGHLRWDGYAPEVWIAANWLE